MTSKPEVSYSLNHESMLYEVFYGPHLIGHVNTSDMGEQVCVVLDAAATIQVTPADVMEWLESYGFDVKVEAPV